MKLPAPDPDDMTPYTGFRSDKELRRALGTHARWKHGSRAISAVIGALAAVVVVGLSSLALMRHTEHSHCTWHLRSALAPRPAWVPVGLDLELPTPIAGRPLAIGHPCDRQCLGSIPLTAMPLLRSSMVLQFPIKLGSQPITSEQQDLLVELRRQLHVAGAKGQSEDLREILLRLGCDSEREMTLALLRLVIDPPAAPARLYATY